MGPNAGLQIFFWKANAAIKSIIFSPRNVFGKKRNVIEYNSIFFVSNLI